MLNAIARRWLVAAGAALAVTAFAPQNIWAAGDPPPQAPPKERKPRTAKPSEPEKSAKPAKPPTTKTKKEKQGALNQDQIYSLGYWQAKNGQFDAALATLQSAADQNDPRVQTMIGFTLRKQG